MDIKSRPYFAGITVVYLLFKLLSAGQCCWSFPSHCLPFPHLFTRAVPEGITFSLKTHLSPLKPFWACSIDSFSPSLDAMTTRAIPVIIIDVSLFSNPAQRQKLISLFCANWYLILHEIIFSLGWFPRQISTLSLDPPGSMLHFPFWFITVLICFFSFSFKLSCSASFSYFMTCSCLPPSFTYGHALAFSFSQNIFTAKQ